MMKMGSCQVAATVIERVRDVKRTMAGIDKQYIS